MSETPKPPSDTADTPAEETPAPLPFGPIGEQAVAAGLIIEACEPDATGKEAIRITGEHLLKVAEYLRDVQKMDMLVSVAGVDWKEHRESVVHLYSTHSHQFLTLKTVADADDSMPSLVPVWPAAHWHERETFDLMGINYQGHPDLRRVLMPVDWIGHPLRKDYKEEDPRLVWNRR
jgi:NADH-quinone oxidoreductase subunit C